MKMEADATHSDFTENESYLIKQRTETYILLYITVEWCDYHQIKTFL